MAAVTGPVSSLPGSKHGFPKETKCDEHPEIEACARIQGETDSMGAEFIDLCEACYKEHIEAMRTYKDEGKCDYCGTHSEDRVTTRDYDEGMCGPVYYVCRPCKKRQSDRLLAEADEYDRYNDY